MEQASPDLIVAQFGAEFPMPRPEQRLLPFPDVSAFTRLDAMISETPVFM